MPRSKCAPKGHRLLAIAAVFALILAGLPMSPSAPRASAQEAETTELGPPPAFELTSPVTDDEDAIGLAAVPGTVDLSSRASSRAFYHEHFVQSHPPLNWTGNLENCVAGTISSAYKQSFVDQINWYRTMAGLSRPVTLSEAKSVFAQEAALLIIKKGQLSHYPDASWPCYSEAGRQGAGSSNIAYGCYDCVSLYMQDPGANNAPVGHRRWLLRPSLAEVGVGTIGSWNATYVSGGSVPGGTRRDGFVAWPPPGYVPYQVVFGRWSFQFPDADLSNATVAVKRNGVPISPTVEYRDWDVVVFNVNEWYEPSADVRYTVTVDNVSLDGESHVFTYDVVVFDPATGGSGALPNAILNPVSAGVGDTVDFTVSAFPANSQVSIALERSGSSPISLGTVTTNSAGRASGSFTVPPITGARMDRVFFRSGSVSKETILEIVARMTLLTPWTVVGGEISIRLSGFMSGEAVGILLHQPDIDSSFWLGNVDFVPDSNGEMVVTFPVPEWIDPGSFEIRSYDWRSTDHVVSGPIVLTDPPLAVTAGSINYQANTLQTTVTLNGSGSTGADGVAITAYDWSIGGATIATGRNATVQLPAGVHNVLLTITDTYGLTASAPLTVTITVAPQTAIADAGPDQYVASTGATASVSLNSSGSLRAPGVTISSYSWTRAGQPTPIATIANPTVSLPNGIHDITLTVTSNFGITTTDQLRVVVGPPPVANAGPDQGVDTYGATAQVTLNGSGSTPPTGGAITEYRWSGLPGGDLTGPTPTVVLFAGTYTATLTITANNGMIATDTVSITVVSIDLPTLSISPTRAAPAAKISYIATNFLRGSEVEITWVSNQGVITSLGSVVVPESGVLSGQVSAVAGPGGFGNYLRFTLGNVSASAEVDVAPRISPSVTRAAPGEAITLNLRGFARNDNVLIRWKVGDTWVDVGTARTTNTGSLTRFPITIPANAGGGLNTIRVQGTISQNSSTVTIVAPVVTITPERTTVNNWLNYTISNFPANSPVSITWVRLTGSTIDIDPVQTDATGAATGRFKVPATSGGPGQQIRFTAGGVTRTVLFEVAPRVKVTPAPAARGEMIDISLRGFARQEAIRIRWRLEGTTTWIVLATGTTSNTGSANIKIPVPEYAVDGTYQLRAETVSFNQQTNVVEIEGGVPVQPAEEPAVTPAPETTPVTIDRSALPLEVTVDLVTITDETGTPELKRLLTDGDLATGWSGTPDPIRHDARLTIDLGENHALRGFGWLTETGGCGKLTGLEYSLDGETWTAIDPYLQPGPIGEGMVWRYQTITEEARYLRFTFAPENPEQTSVGCLAEVAVWGTRIDPEPVIEETPVPTEPVIEETPTPTEESPIEPTPVPDEPAPDSTPEPDAEE